MDFEIPDRLTFKRKEVIRITKLDGKVLDYWENEFVTLSPVVNKTGEKFYTKKDIELILNIKQWFILERKPKEEVKEMLGQWSNEAMIRAVCSTLGNVGIQPAGSEYDASLFQ